MQFNKNDIIDITNPTNKSIVDRSLRSKYIMIQMK